MRFTLIISIGLFFSERLFSQTTYNSIERIKIFVRAIDSLSDIRTGDVRLILKLEEGYVSITKKGKFKSSGFSLATVTSFNGDTVFLIQHSDGLEKNLIESYYFKSDKLVFSRIELLQDREDDNTTLFLQQEYYYDDKVRLSTVDKNGFRKKLRWRTDFDHKKQAYYYLKNYKKV